MAFVFSGPRFAPNQTCQTPGPGSHCPDLIQSPRNINSSSSLRKCLRKGKAFVKVLRNEELSTSSPINSITTPNTSEQAFPKNAKKQIKSTKSYDLSNFQSQNKSININQGKFFEISSLQRGVFLEINKQKSLDIKDEASFSKFQNIDLKKTVASIKQVYPEKFYIGSKDQYSKRKSKKHSTKNHFNNRIRSGLNRQEIETKQSNISERKSQKVKKSKPISAKHPFKRNEHLYQDNYKYDQKSTRIQEQEQVDEEQGSQFIDDAVPGPGAYQVNNFTQSTKKCPLFTQVNKQRFQQKPNSNNLAHQFVYSYQPNTRKSKSRASQRKVGFGRSLTHKSTTITSKMLEDIEQPPAFYDNSKSIENKCVRLKLKDALNPGFFISKVQRFPETSKKISLNSYRNQLAQQEHLNKMKKQFNDHKLTHPFNSTVERQKVTPPLTADIEYSGQQYKTIENNLRHILSQPKYFYQDNPDQLDFQTQIQKTQALKLIKPPAKQIRSQIQIKHHLIENIYGFRQRNKKLSKKQIKAYTFNTNQMDMGNKQNNPDPTKYYKQLKWVKDNFNMRFQYKVETRKVQDQLEEEDSPMLDDALKIVRI